MTDVNEIFELDGVMSQKDKELVTKAYEFAKKAHEGTLRKSGDPYFIHVFETSKTLARIGMDAKTIAAGLLHDTLEDTTVTEEEMEKEFGIEIVKLVNGVTKLGKVKYRGRERHVESLRKFFMAMADDLRILIIKLADRLHNISTIEHLPEEKRKRIAIETIEIHARLADRIGMGMLKGDLEDYAFPYAYPKEYAEVVKLLEIRKATNEKELMDVTNILSKELTEQKIKIFEIDQRVKHKYSLWKKLERYNMDIDKIYDIIAIRVVVGTIGECYHTLGIIHKLWNPLPGRIKDYIAVPKPNGYRSLHTTIFTGNGGILEIQIRTQEMHAEAAYGIAAHFVYKEHGIKNKKKNAEPVEKKLEWIDQLKELQKVVAEPAKFLEHLKTDFFRDRIFIFTPKGDVVDLPEDSGTIDFAFAIHSDIGFHVSGAKINGKLSPLSTKLKNGDIVEIIVSKNSHPASKWLDYTKTSLAKRHIRSYLEENSLYNKFFGKK